MPQRCNAEAGDYSPNFNKKGIMMSEQKHPMAVPVAEHEGHIAVENLIESGNESEECDDATCPECGEMLEEVTVPATPQSLDSEIQLLCPNCGVGVTA